MTPIFDARHDAYLVQFGDSRAVMTYFHGQAEFPRILRQNGQHDLENQSITPIFNTNPEYPRMHICHKFDDSSSNMWRLTSYRVDKVNFTDRRTDGWTHAGNDNTPSAWKAKGQKGTNWYHFNFYFNYHLMYFQLKTNSVGITEVSFVPMTNDMYFIQWIITSCYPNGYKLYRNNFVSWGDHPDGVLRTTLSCSTAHFSPTSWPSGVSVAHHRGRGRSSAAFNVTLLIFVLEIPFNFKFDMQCAGNANSNVSFQVNASSEQILFPWHTWARSKGLKTIGSEWPN